MGFDLDLTGFDPLEVEKLFARDPDVDDEADGRRRRHPAGQGALSGVWHGFQTRSRTSGGRGGAGNVKNRFRWSNANSDIMRGADGAVGLQSAEWHRELGCKSQQTAPNCWPLSL